MAQFVAEHYLNEFPGGAENIAQLVEQGQLNRKKLCSNVFQRIVLWVEHDSYDQLMMIALLASMPPAVVKKMSVVEVGQFPGTKWYIGLGQLPPQAIRSCWAGRRRVTESMRNCASGIWAALCTTTPDMLLRLIKTEADLHFPYIKPVLFRHLQQLPHRKRGLNLTQTLALEALAAQGGERMNLSALFADYQRREPLPFLGDLMFWAMIKPLTEGDVPLITCQAMPETQFSDYLLGITEHGRHCLSGRIRWRLQDGYVGGIRVSEQQGWCWDHLDTATLQAYQRS